ncbi:MAG: biotin--[acetyl-CoA-carboxylase] ligase [Candidatus Omnitrophica bacterium]|nr:biotin--[acetyl-CoA-carboxylase] ligase [Candidatus Omnitrophota bacterium]
MSQPSAAAPVARDCALEARLRQHLEGTAMGRSLYAFSSVGSTMEVAHELAQQRAPHGTLVWAQRQEQGRGRLGRVWESPAGGAYFSLILWPLHTATEIPQLSLVAGLAAVQTIQQSAGLFATIRWPNDVLIDGKKVCGILVEAAIPFSTQHQAHSTQSYVIIGVGLNVTTDPLDLPEHATSLKAAGAMHADSYELTAALCRQFQTWYDVWSSQGFAPIREALRPFMGLFGQVVHIAAGSSRFEGTASDLDEQGRLVVRLDSGVQRAFDMGEVTLLR